MTKNYPNVLMVPGLWGSTPLHWQSIWETESPEFTRVNQLNWDLPKLHDWIEKLNEYVLEAGENTVLVAHSLGCALVAHWAKQFEHKILGALLVAPTDCDMMRARDPEIESFTPMPLEVLNFKSFIIASTNDECVSFDRAEYFAKCWGSSLINVGDKGHINADSSLGNWVEGREYLELLIRSVQPLPR